jgi:hypothetical protein
MSPLSPFISVTSFETVSLRASAILRNSCQNGSSIAILVGTPRMVTERLRITDDISRSAWSRRPKSGASFYLATRNWLKLVPILLKVVTISLADVNRKNFSLELAQFCSSVEVGSPSVLTWMV